MSKLVILSDIHSNSVALKAVVDRLENSDPDTKFCFLGDSINYGPDPLGVIRIIKRLFDTGKIIENSNGMKVLIAGNHEEAWLWLRNKYADLIKQLSNSPSVNDRTQLLLDNLGTVKREYSRDHPEIMAEHAIHSLLITAAQLSRINVEDDVVSWYAGQMNYSLSESQKATIAVNFDGWNLLFAHSDIYNLIYQREIYPCDHQKLLRYIERLKLDNKVSGNKSVLIHGHNHIPMFFGFSDIGSSGSGSITANEPLTYDLEIPACMGISILNPGSLGQPRDRDIRPAFAELKTTEDSLMAIFYRIQIREEDRAQLINQLRVEQFPDNTIRIALESPLPAEVERNCGPGIFLERA